MATNFTNLTNPTAVIYGPTATGKTALALNLAKKFNGELVSADSRQVYKRLDIGTGKVSLENQVNKHRGYWEVDGVRINGFDLAEPGKNFDVAQYLSYATPQIARIKKEKKLPIIVGGTGFYIKALIGGIDTIGVTSDPELRVSLEKLTREELFNKLQNINPGRANSMNNSDRLNPRRVMRAIEIFMNNKSKNIIKKNIEDNYLFLGLIANNDFIYEKSDRWLDTRLNTGLVNEVKELIKSGVDKVWLKNLGLEYRWLTLYLEGEMSFDQSLLRLKGDTHSFIRRQKTWFKQFPNITLYNVEEKNYQQKIEKKFLGRE